MKAERIASLIIDLTSRSPRTPLSCCPSVLTPQIPTTLGTWESMQVPWGAQIGLVACEEGRCQEAIYRECREGEPSRAKTPQPCHSKVAVIVSLSARIISPFSGYAKYLVLSNVVTFQSFSRTIDFRLRNKSIPAFTLIHKWMLIANDGSIEKYTCLVPKQQHAFAQSISTS